jgi:formylglycine-generating enzyme required for sulfatase activity
MTKILIFTLLALGFQSASAVTLTESFGTGANAFTMDFVTIDNPNNAADIRYYALLGKGSVAYTYNLGKHEVSRGQIDKANAAGSLGITMSDLSGYGGNGVNKPATGITYYEALKYANWLNTSTGGTAAYKFDGSGTFQLWSSTDAGYNANNMFRNSLAKYVIVSSDEWYKGAYGNPNGTWNDYPTGSNSAPTAVASGTAANTAVYGQSASTGPADITNAGGLSRYGTMGQGGNVMEWIETAYDGINNTAGEDRGLRGGGWSYDSIYLGAWSDNGYNPSGALNYNYGFRVASVPEPSTGLLVVLGLGGLLFKRRKTGTL